MEGQVCISKPEVMVIRSKKARFRVVLASSAVKDVAQEYDCNTYNVGCIQYHMRFHFQFDIAQKGSTCTDYSIYCTPARTEYIDLDLVSR